MWRKYVIGFGVAAVPFMLLLAGCSKGGGDSASVTKKEEDYKDEPIKLLVNTAVDMNDEDFDKLIVRPVQKKYPNITFEKVKNAEELMAAGSVPDLVHTSNAQINISLDLGLGEDLTPMLKKYNIDLNRFEPEVINNIKQIGKNGEFYGIPLDLNVGLTLYNKDIFDKFGVPYPADGMTWTQLLALAKKVTLMDGGVQYIGADPGTAQSMIRQYSLPVVDEKQERAVLTSEGYKHVFTLMRQFYDIPGYIGPNKEYRYSTDAFFKNQNLAMYPSWMDGVAQRLTESERSGKPVNWDVVSYPAYDDRPGLSKQVDIHMFMVPPTSKHKDAAYRVLQLIASDEAQAAMNRSTTRLTVLKNPEYKKSYTEELGIFKGKNLAGMFKVKPAPAPASTIYDNKIYTILGNVQKDMAQTGVDVNTTLRLADEQANKVIAEIKNSKK